MRWLYLLLLPFLLAGATLFVNRAPLLDPPGPLARLKLYLTTHVARTSVDHVRPELRPLHLESSEEAAKASVINAMRQLQWSEIREEQGRLHAVVVTRWLSFQDDLVVQLEPTETGVLVQVESTSRLGRGDFAANTRHILDLFELLHRLPDSR